MAGKKKKAARVEEVVEAVTPLVEVAVEKELELKPPSETPEARDERLISATIRAVTTDLLPAMMAAMKQGTNTPQFAAAEAKIKRRELCQVCRQAVSGCGGVHSEMIVFPQKYPEFGKWFQGVTINGVRYLSDNATDYVTVPASCVSSISNMVRAYEENERVMRMGRTAEHNSGDSRAPKQPNQAWR